MAGFEVIPEDPEGLAGLQGGAAETQFVQMRPR
jgi:hypothetical protein